MGSAHFYKSGMLTGAVGLPRYIPTVDGASLAYDSGMLPDTPGTVLTQWEPGVGGLVLPSFGSPTVQVDSDGFKYAHCVKASSQKFEGPLARTAPHTVISVVAFDAKVVTDIQPVTGSGADSPVPNLMAVSPNATAGTVGGFRAFSGTTLALPVPPVIAPARRFVMLATFNGASSVVRVNNVEQAGDAGSSVGSKFSIGYYVSSGAARYSDLRSYHHAIVPRALTLGERGEAVALMADMFDVQL